MEQVNKPTALETTFDVGGLFVGVSIFNSLGALIHGPVAANNFDGPSYGLIYTFAAVGAYFSKFVVYTDAGFTIPDPNYSQSSQGHQVLDILGPLSVLSPPNPLIGVIDEVQT